MPLPQPNQVWPPAAVAPITAKQTEWDAWYSSDTDRLAEVYRTQRRPSLDRVSQYRGGVQGAVARMWWGRPVGDLTSRSDADKLHVPIAADLCQASSDLLFAEPPSLTSADQGMQSELDTAVEEGLVSVLAEAGEIGAALGDVYLRVTWDPAFADRSFLTAVHADAAWPEFRWGRLVGVTFWHVVRQTDREVWRHVERHELAGTGRDATGVILHGLYQGTADNLGRLIPLAEHDSTKGIAVNEDSAIDTQTPGLAVVHVPNQRPQRLWRRHPVGANLGRSDLAGIEPLMDKLDMVYSSWMRDVRLAKARLIVPGYMLESQGPGRGAFFDEDQDIWTPVNQPPREDGANQITPQQFTIRVADHQATCQQLVEDILRTAGYSKQTFGEGSDVAVTATEVTSKDRRSNLTRDRKIRAMRPALVAIVRKKLAVDAAVFSSGVDAGEAFTVDFVDTTQADPEALARTSETLFRAQAASTETRVRIAHPDWDEIQIGQEAARVLEEFGAMVPDPVTLLPPGAAAGAAGDEGAGVGSEDAGES